MNFILFFHNLVLCSCICRCHLFRAHGKYARDFWMVYRRYSRIKRWVFCVYWNRV